MKKGFTLVELSIVLVIIGLLIGGILAAQSMIGTAKIQALVRQVGQFDAAVVNFQTKYGQLPGDNNLMGANPGDNNGIITDGPIVGGNNNYFFGEIGKFWADLSHSGFSKADGGSYPDYSNNTSQIKPNSSNLPTPAMGSKGLVFAIGSPISKNNYYLMAHIETADLTICCGLSGIFKVVDVQAVDTKMDDGLANAGNVQGWGGSNLTNDGVSNDYMETASHCATGGQYTLTSTTLCGIKFRIGTATGSAN